MSLFLRRRIFVQWLCIAQLLVCSFAYAANNSLQPIPPLTGPVIDLTGTLSAAQQQQLSQKLIALHDKYHAQMQVLIIPTSAPEDAFTYSMRVVDKWKLGTAKQDDGLLLFIAKNDHRSQIQVGYGLEGVIPDVIAHRLLNDVMAPYFKQGNFYGGIDAVIDGVYQRVSGGEVAIKVPPANNSSHGQSNKDISNAMTLLIFGGGLVINLLRKIISGFLALLAGIFLILSVGWLTVGPLAIIALVPALIIGFGNLRLWGSTSSGGGWSGSSGGGGGFGGGGFSGGGGGGFGGGGSGGSW